MSPAIDFSEVQGLEPVEAGSYLASIVHAEPGMSKKEQPKIDVRWLIDENEEEGIAGRQVFDTLSFHPDALWRTKKTLQALGFSEDFKGEVEVEDLLNQQALIVVDLEDSEQIDPVTGEAYPLRNRIKAVRPASASAASLLE